jgi:hypothetical protein
MNDTTFRNLIGSLLLSAMVVMFLFVLAEMM